MAERRPPQLGAPDSPAGPPSRLPAIPLPPSRLPAIPLPPSRLPAILHVDMDSFFASVEVLDDPSLAGKPVVVGGNGARGVVASCTYEARAYGVHSAMPSLRARALCPHAVFVDGHYSRYAEVSAQLRQVLLSFTPVVEQIGLDEAFLDVRGALHLLGPPGEIGAAIRRSVRERLSLDCSVGAGRSKMIAKLASRAAKPRAGPQGKLPGTGVVVVDPADELAFLHPKAVEELWGVGPVTRKRLAGLGVRTVGDLAALPDSVLVRALGKVHGRHFALLARGEDSEPVVPDRPTKSVGHEETFRQDIVDRGVLGRHARRMAESVAGHLRANGQVAKTITVKVKLADFSLVTRAHTTAIGLDSGPAISAIAFALLDAVDLPMGARLLGVSASGLQAASAGRQLRFSLAGTPGTPGTPGSAGADAPDQQEHWREVTAAIDVIRRRFGTTAVGTASMMGPGGIVVPGRREAPWGPGTDDTGGEEAGSRGEVGDGR